MEYRKWLSQKAKELRKNPTKAENKVIEYLKRNNISYHFQVPIMVNKNKGYIADFVLFGNVILEIDGSVHETDESKKKDKQRTNDLESAGYQVIRMRNQSTSGKNINRVMLDRLNKTNPETAARIQNEIDKQKRIEYWKKRNSDKPKPDWDWKTRIWDASGGHFKNYE